jgi:hypothetical protein
LKQIDWSSVLVLTDVDLALKRFSEIFLSVLNKVSPFRDFKVRQKDNPWMCNEIFAGIKKRDILFAMFKRYKSRPGAYSEYCKQRNLVQRDIKFAKADFFRHKLNVNKDDSSKLWRQLGSLGYKTKGKGDDNVVLETEGVKCFSPLGVATIFNEFYTSVAAKLVNNLPLPSGLFGSLSDLFVKSYRNKGIFDPRFTLMPVRKHFINKQLSSLKPDKSTGLDDIPPRFLRDGAEFLVEPVCHIVNISILTETVPSGFKQARVKPLFKKGSRLDPGNYRPVSILSVLSKILERAVNGQLNEYLNSRGLLYEFQSGFRGKYSTDTCLMNLSDYVKGEISRGNYVGMVMIDLQKAFDCVDHGVLIQKLSAMGVSSLDWFRSYLGDREQCTHVKGVDSPFLGVTCGVPQGSILGPTLFLCYVNDMPVSLNCNLVLYADVSALIASGPDPNKLAEFLSGELGSCQRWLVDNKLSLHVGKTECILFWGSHKIKRAVEFVVKLGEDVVRRVTSVKYLGVTLDQALNFGEHLQLVLNKGIT